MSWAISALGLALSSLMVWKIPSPAPLTPAPSLAEFPMIHSLAAIASLAALATLGTILGWFQYHSEGLVVEPAQHPLHAQLQGGIDLLSYDIPGVEVRPGEDLSVMLYWKAREPVAENYQVFVHMRRGDSPHTWGQSDRLNPGDYPTTRWPTDRYVRDSHTLTIPLGTPPGDYTLGVGLWNHLTGYRQLVVDSDGTILGDTITLPTPITVLPPIEYPSPEELPLAVETMLPLADGVTLLGARLHPGEDFDVEMGFLTVALYWRAERDDLPDFTVRVRLVDTQRNVMAMTEGAPADEQYPTTAWSAGEVIRDLHSFWLDSDIPDGHYTIEVGLEPNEWEPITEFERILPTP
jgi:hypothetical protein